jgi:hypothetical protein
METTKEDSETHHLLSICASPEFDISLHLEIPIGGKRTGNVGARIYRGPYELEEAVRPGIPVAFSDRILRLSLDVGTYTSERRHIHLKRLIKRI